MGKRIYPVSDHFDGQRFFNIHATTAKTLADIVRYRRERQGPAWPRRIHDPAFPPPPNQVGPGEIAITFIGHATFLIRTDRLAILTDPIFSKRAGPLGRVGPVRVRPAAIPMSHLPVPDLVLVSHNHYDHMDLASLRALRRHGARQFVTGLGNAPYLGRRGIGPAVELDWWEPFDGPHGIRITFVPAQHWSLRADVRANSTLWGGFVIETGSARIYFAGDTGYCPHFTEIAAAFPPIDVALLPIGAFEPRWFMAPQHMGPDEAVRAHLELGAKASIAMHFGTFRLTPEAFDAAEDGLRGALAAYGVDPGSFRVPGFGETMVFRAQEASAA